MSDSRLDDMGFRDRETSILDSIRRAIREAADEKQFGEIVFRITFVEGRPKLLEVTGKTSYKFE
jgi:hypothetical protein